MGTGVHGWGRGVQKTVYNFNQITSIQSFLRR